MVAREDHFFSGHPLFAASSVIHLLFIFFDKDKVPKNVQKAVALQGFLPEVTAAVTAGVLRVARAALNLPRLAAPVKRQKKGFLLG